jgi:hypothetical protein
VIRFDPRKLVDENGNLKKLKELDDATALALHSVDFDGNVISKVRVDKSTARSGAVRKQRPGRHGSGVAIAA